MRTLPLLTPSTAALLAQDRPIVLNTSTLFDGKGKTLHNTILVVEESKIARIGSAAPTNTITFDLSAFTVSPGWIDTQTHLSYHFDNKDHYAGRYEPPSQAALPARSDRTPMTHRTSVCGHRSGTT